MAIGLPCIFGSFHPYESSSEKVLLRVEDHDNKLLLACKVNLKASLSGKAPQKNIHCHSLHVLDPEFRRHLVNVNFKKAYSENHEIKNFLTVNEIIKYIKRKQGIDQFIKIFSSDRKFPLLPRPKIEHTLLTAEQRKDSTSLPEKQKKEPLKNIPLNNFQIFTLIAEIERHKEAWLQEAEGRETWIRRKISIPLEGFPQFVVKLDIFSSDRMGVEQLGRIDLKKTFIFKGSLKKVFENFNYETLQITAGQYASTKNGSDRLVNEIRMQGALKKSVLNTPLARHFVISKSIDTRNSLTNPDVEKVKFTQTYLKDGSLMEILEMDLLPDNAPYSKNYKMSFAIDILIALEFFHTQGVLHRDVKSENIMIEFSEELGRYIAKLNDYDLSSRMGTESFAGTPGYVAPEILLGNIGDPRSDLYSLGRSLQENNFEPWWYFDKNNITGEINIALLEERVKGDFCERARPSQTDTWNWFIWKITHENREQRFSSAREARLFLETSYTE